MVNFPIELFTHFAAGCGNQTFLGLLPWYAYLQMAPQNGVCQVTNFQLLGAHSSILLILIAVVDDLLRIVGLAAVIFVIYAGVKYIMSQGSPDKTAEALGTIQNALMGLALSVIAIWFVSFIGNQFSNGVGGTSPIGLDLSSLPNPTGIDNGGIVQTLLNVAFGIIGALSFLFIVIGGFRYISSQGDPQITSKAKNTIMYALIGLVVAIIAQSIVSVTINKI